MERSCPKCGHLNLNATGEPLDTCPACGLIYSRFDDAAALKMRVVRARTSGDWSGIPAHAIPVEFHAQAAAQMPVTTTPMLPGFTIAKAIDVVSAECAFGMNLLKDFYASVTDVVGGRSGSTQKVLREARRQAMAELRAEAFALGADGIVGVKLDFNEFSGGGKSMVFVVATGTAVKLTQINR